MLEDINNILNTGDIPNLYDLNDIEEINRSMKNVAQEKGVEQTPANILNLFLNIIKQKSHIICALSPMKETFRIFLRNFPSLVNCTTIDFYQEWPVEALIGVALVKMKLNDHEFDKHKELNENIANVMSMIHKSIEH